MLGADYAQACRGKSINAVGNECRCRVRRARSTQGGGSHLGRRGRRAGALLEPGADVGEQLDLLDGGVGLAHALVPQPRLLAAVAYWNRRQELLHVVRGRERMIAPGV